MVERSYNRYGLNCQRSHLVLLGAGASKAAFPNGEKKGLKLPLMNNFIETIHGLSDYLDKNGINYKGQNFEDLYSSLCDNSQYDQIRQNIEGLIFDYFSQMELPDEPTLYDHLILSLTGRDAIATFNWDPLLWQAAYRNYHRVGRFNLPWLIYLHGNTAIGVCTNHDKIQVGHRGYICSKCRKPASISKLLYPIRQKDYNSDKFIKSSWDGVKIYLEHSYMLTIFGYGAPSSDIEAVNLLSEGWGDKHQREMEQIEVIDVVKEDILRTRWDKFILSHHYDTYDDFYSSMIGKCSRRSTDASFGANFNCVAWREYPVPKEASWNELDEWLKLYINAENKARQTTLR